jgi:hypothetical protein
MAISIHAALENVSALVWDTLGAAQSVRLPIGEETLTDFILLHLLRSGSPSVRVLKLPKPVEKRVGADWEWWVGSNGGGWRRYAVQAKKLDHVTGRYKSLAHRVGGRYQVDILQAYSLANAALPLYCFYNNVPLPDAKLAWNCPNPTIDVRQLGCSVAHASVVKRAIATRGARTFKALHMVRSTIPLRCLVCARRVAKDGDTEVLALVRGEGSTGIRDKALHNRLPEEYQESAAENGCIGYAHDVYDSSVALYPRRIAILEVGSSVDCTCSRW